MKTANLLKRKKKKNVRNLTDEPKMLLDFYYIRVHDVW